MAMCSLACSREFLPVLTIWIGMSADCWPTGRLKKNSVMRSIMRWDRGYASWANFPKQGSGGSWWLMGLGDHAGCYGMRILSTIVSNTIVWKVLPCYLQVKIKLHLFK